MPYMDEPVIPIRACAPTVGGQTSTEVHRQGVPAITEAMESGQDDRSVQMLLPGINAIAPVEVEDRFRDIMV